MLSAFIGSVNKLIDNFGNLQKDLIAKLFRSYCCSFYGSQAWQIVSTDYKRICITWNKSVRNILKFPYTTWMQGPLLDQSQILYQLQRRTLRFILPAIGHNVAYFRNNYSVNFSHDICFNKNIHFPLLCEEKRLIFAQLNNLLLVKCGLYTIARITMSNINIFIKLLATA